MGSLTLFLLPPPLVQPRPPWFRKKRTRLIGGLAVAAIGSALVMSWWLLAGFDLAAPGMQYLKMFKWNQRPGTS